MTATESEFDEVSALKSLQADATAIGKHLEAIAKLKATDAEAVDKLEKAAAAIPSGEQMARAVDELRSRAEQIVASARATRTERFGRHEAEFVREARAAEKGVREAGNNAWRIGPLEIEVKRDSSRARVLYNREAVTGWTPIAARQDIDRLVESANRSLEKAALPAELLPIVMVEAYDHLRRHHGKPDAQAVRVPLPELFRELRVVLARHELKAGKPDRKLSRTELPRWAFLYNLDLYRRMLPGLPAEQRLSLETGSQHDHQKGLAMVVNGLEPSSEYKTYCYVYAPQTGTK